MRNIVFEDEIVKFELENEILIGTIKTEFVNLDVADRITKSRFPIQNGKDYLMVSNITFVKNSTKDARHLFASKEGCVGVIAAAIIINSSLSTMIGNFFLSVNKPIVPSKLFTNEEDAKKWLKQYQK